AAPAGDQVRQPQTSDQRHGAQAREVTAGEGAGRTGGKAEDGEGLARPEEMPGQLAHIGRPIDQGAVARGGGKANAGAVGGDEPDVEFGEDPVETGKAFEARTLKAVEVQNWRSGAGAAIHVCESPAVVKREFAEGRVG